MIESPAKESITMIVVHTGTYEDLRSQELVTVQWVSEVHGECVTIIQAKSEVKRVPFVPQRTLPPVPS